MYSDYLLSSFGQVTATGLSGLLEGAVSHDKITRMLSGSTNNSKELWQEVKPLVRKYKNEAACLIFDDTLVSKPCTDENELIGWHWENQERKTAKSGNQKCDDALHGATGRTTC
ncbi:MAG: hypothetical protein LBB84_11535 [Tannerellaceae bacterium]|jgi:hypothetical protein|nr:hypothetical protein [Tannerellaceae bacterium]